MVCRWGWRSHQKEKWRHCKSVGNLTRKKVEKVFCKWQDICPSLLLTLPWWLHHSNYYWNQLHIFSWGPREQAAFGSLKNSPMEQTSLAYFVPGQTMIIYVDAGKKTEEKSCVRWFWQIIIFVTSYNDIRAYVVSLESSVLLIHKLENDCWFQKPIRHFQTPQPL